MLESLSRLLLPRSKRLKIAALDAVFEDSRGARMITDIHGNVVNSNERMQVICKPNKVSLQAVRALFPDQGIFENIRIAGEQGSPDQIETRASLMGQEKWVTLTVMPVAGVAGLVHWRIDDITARKSLETLIREERERLIDFTDHAPVGFYTVDINGGFTYVNATLARWLDSDPQSLLNRKLHDIFADLPPGLAPYDAPEEARLMGHEGVTMAVAITQHLENNDNPGVQARGIMYDRTAERRMQHALRESEDRFKVFFDEAPLGIALIDRSGIIRDANPRLVELLHPNQAGIDGRALTDFVHDAGSKEVMTRFLAALESGRLSGRAIELTLAAHTGPLPVQMFARLLPDQGEAVLHFIDLSEQKRLEAQFVQSQKMQAVGQLAGGIAHDFNNLLTAMIGFCDLLLLRHKPSDSSFADVMQIKQNANRAANLVRQLLAFSRQQTLQPKVLDPSELLTELSHLLRRLIGPNIDFKLVHNENLGFIKADQGQFEQVIINLVVNARDAMDGTGTLTVTMKVVDTDKTILRGGDEQPPGHWVVIEVADSGCGIPKENLTRIFDPFFTTKAVGAGTGLGLATVYGIVRQTGAFISVDSVIGKGTTFSLHFPRVAQREAEAVEANVVEEVADLTGVAHIVLVEDEDAVRAFSSRALSNKGYQVSAFPDGVQALDWFKEQKTPPDLLITDVIMPELDGPGLAKAVREMWPELKIVFVSGYTEDKFKKQLGEDVHFLPKPFSLQQLAAKVKEVLT